MVAAVVAWIVVLGASAMLVGSANDNVKDQEIFVANMAVLDSEYLSDGVNQGNDSNQSLRMNHGADESEKEKEDMVEHQYLSDEIPLDYDTQIYLRALCEQYSVPCQIALGVIEAESSFQADARNGSCYGYMQINTINQERLADEIGVTDLTDPLQNLHSGVFMLGHLYKKYDDWSKALVAYNCGETGAYKNFFSKGVTSNQYSLRVLALQDKWAEVIE